MIRSVRAAFVLVLALSIAGLTACGGGGGDDVSPSLPPTEPTVPVEPSEPPTEPTEPTEPVDPPTGLSLSLPAGHGLAAGQFTVQPGSSAERGNVVVSCPAGGSACVVTVAADGTASYDRTGGTPSIMAAYGPWELPSGHGLVAGQFTIQPGSSDEHGNVVVSCPAGGGACVVTVAADGTATYARTGGMPSVMAALGVSMRTESDGLPALDLLTYFTAAACPPSAMCRNLFNRFSSPPTLHIEAGTNDTDRTLVHYAVGLINRALPYNQHVRVGPDYRTRGGEKVDFLDKIQYDALYEVFGVAPGHVSIPPGRLNEAREISVNALKDVLDHDITYNQILVDFGSVADGVGGYAVAILPTYNFPSRPGYNPLAPRVGYVWINKVNDGSEGQLEASRHAGRIQVLAHELLHSFGFEWHLYGTELNEHSNIGSYSWNEGRKPMLPALDIAALQIAHRPLEAIVYVEDFTLDSFGPWEQESINLTGEFRIAGAELSFGVRHGNGLSVPWTLGELPASPLGDNRALSGTVTWQGELLGFTLSLRPVRGNAQIGVNLASMNGAADFTDLQSWTAGQAPGEIGTGTQWGEGGLAYTITVGGNFIRSTGGDAGSLHGHFVGDSHQGVVGSVERDDLTAAFGANR